MHDNFSVEGHDFRRDIDPVSARGSLLPQRSRQSKLPHLILFQNSRLIGGSQVAIIGTLLYLIKSRTIAIKMCHIKINFILFSPSYASPENPIHHSVIFKMTCQSRIFLCLSDKLNWNLTKTDDWCKEKKPNCAHVCWFSSRSSKTLQQLNGWIC